MTYDVRRHSFNASGFNPEGYALGAAVNEVYSSDAMQHNHSTVESFSYTLGGRVHVGGPGNWGTSTGDRTSFYATNSGRITLETRVGGVKAFRYDSAGNTVLTSLEGLSGMPAVPIRYDDRESYYDAAGVVRQSERKYHDRQPPGFGLLP